MLNCHFKSGCLAPLNSKGAIYRGLARKGFYQAYFSVLYSVISSVHHTRAGAVQWFKLPAWKVKDRRFEPHSGHLVSKKQNISSPLTRKDSILWGAPWPKGSVLGLRPLVLKFRILIHLSNILEVLLTRFSLYVRRKVAWNPIHFISGQGFYSNCLFFRCTRSTVASCSSPCQRTLTAGVWHHHRMVSSPYSWHKVRIHT